MSVIFRPLGDEIASIYGDYYSSSDLKSISAKDRVDVLCSDGLNYIGIVKHYDSKKDIGQIHFLRWSTKFDYNGPFTILYLAEEGKHSKSEGISNQNHYPQLIINDSVDTTIGSKSSKRLKERQSIQTIEVDNKRFKSQRYSEDFLAKPRWKFNNKSRESDVKDKDNIIVELTTNDSSKLVDHILTQVASNSKPKHNLDVVKVETKPNDEVIVDNDLIISEESDISVLNENSLIPTEAIETFKSIEPIDNSGKLVDVKANKKTTIENVISDSNFDLKFIRNKLDILASISKDDLILSSIYQLTQSTIDKLTSNKLVYLNELVQARRSINKVIYEITK